MQKKRNIPATIGCTLFLFVSGIVVYVIIFSRLLADMRSGTLKYSIIAIIFFIVAFASIAAGLVLKNRHTLILSIAIFFGITCEEVILVIDREQYKASPPNPKISYYDDILKPVTTMNLKAYHFTIDSPGWKGKRLRIAQVSDLHVDRKLPLIYYRHVSTLVRNAEPSFIFFTGDYVSDSKSFELLAEVCGYFGFARTYAVLGNHDYWVDEARVKQVLRLANIRVIENETIGVPFDGRTFDLSGFDKPWGDYDYEHYALRTSKSSISIVLSHNPDNIFTLNKEGADIVLSGHYHAGQVRLPFFGALVAPTILGRTFDHGHFLIKGTDLFVSGGIGTIGPPVRIYCNPDVFIIDID